MHSDPVSDSELCWGERTQTEEHDTNLWQKLQSNQCRGSEAQINLPKNSVVCMVLSNSTPENPGFHWFTLGKTVAYGKELTNQTWPGTDTTCSPPRLPSVNENLRLFSPWPQQAREIKTEGLNKTNLTKGSSKDGNEKGREVRTGTEAQKWNDTEGVTHSGAGPSFATQEIWQWSTNPIKLGQHR